MIYSFSTDSSHDADRHRDSSYLEVRIEPGDGERGALVEERAAERRREGDAQPDQEELKGNHRLRVVAEEAPLRRDVRHHGRDG